MVRAVFLDFYGTVVHEGGEVIKKIIRVNSADGCLSTGGGRQPLMMRPDFSLPARFPFISCLI